MARQKLPRGRLLLSVYRRLYRHYGDRNWWPADSPFEVMVGAVLTQNTAWTNVERAIANLKSNRALDAKVLAELSPQLLAEWIKPSGYFNIKAKRLQNFCRWYVAQNGYRELQKESTDILRTALLSVNGVGPETADDILLYAFDRPVFVIDAYTRRLMSRLGILDGDQDYESLRAAFESALQPDVTLFNQYHALIVEHGKNICRPRPRCGDCVLRSDCPGAIH
ncbi:MAG: endonuclease III domain-containing protein [Gammaproteobacteria bacterium]